MQSLSRPLVLIHGLWDNPNLFNPLLSYLNLKDDEYFSPYIPHRYGRTSLRSLASYLDKLIDCKYGSICEIDILGFSMGGLISRIWLQELNGRYRTKRFFTIGSPHNGTLLAQFIPGLIARGIADMKIKSNLLSSLNSNYSLLETVECFSFYCIYDLMVIPGYSACLSIGYKKSLPVISHKGLLRNKQSLSIISKYILPNTL